MTSTDHPRVLLALKHQSAQSSSRLWMLVDLKERRCWRVFYDATSAEAPSELANIPLKNLVQFLRVPLAAAASSIMMVTSKAQRD